mmetsp:Transcript_34030/g.33577  ORF Transcript_34030/g.33577 Transcript_34030/m.33577 type:complete len:107 (-) Transcript_34030:246-566(-)
MAYKYKNQIYDLVMVPIQKYPYINLESLISPKNTSRFVFQIKIPDFRESTEDNPNLKRKFIIGRGHESDLRVTDISVSRTHTDIIYEKGRFIIEDKLSKFGTLLKV